MKKYPMKLSPVAKDALWGGDNLCRLFPNRERVAEAWLASVRAGKETLIENGVYAHMSLADYLGTEDFPLLVKLIDAKEPLSVQVHPADGEDAKTEMWYVISSLENSEIIYGAKNLEHINRNCFERIYPKPGDVIFIPAGQIHSIGAGILLCEIQQNSDTTYRLFDYNRGRELHVEKALKNVKIRNHEEIYEQQFSRGRIGLCYCDHFKVEKHSGNSLFPTADNFRIIVCVSGNGRLICKNELFTLSFGDTYLIPGGCSNVIVEGNTEILEITK